VKYLKASAFADEARLHFGFLWDDDFLGPEEGEYRLSYSSRRLAVDVLYDDRDGRVLTVVRSFLAGRTPRAGLPCLYVAAGIGPQQDIREIARSSKLLGAVLDSQARALQRVLPVFDGPRGPELLSMCHGR